MKTGKEKSQASSDHTNQAQEQSDARTIVVSKNDAHIKDSTKKIWDQSSTKKILRKLRKVLKKLIPN